jgi:hypothetical protein
VGVPVYRQKDICVCGGLGSREVRRRRESKSWLEEGCLDVYINNRYRELTAGGPREWDRVAPVIAFKQLTHPSSEFHQITFSLVPGSRQAKQQKSKVPISYPLEQTSQAIRWNGNTTHTHTHCYPDRGSVFLSRGSPASFRPTTHLSGFETNE